MIRDGIPKKIFTLGILGLASTHCVLSIFSVNHSYIDLHQYAHGQVSPLVFQRRLLMIPLMRWAESSALLSSLAGKLGSHIAQPEPMTGMKLVCIVIGIVLINLLGVYSLRFSRKIGLRQTWLVWAILLAILYASYGARYEQPLWYPYDLPNIFLFGLATMFLLEDLPWAFLPAMALDVFVRESSLLLLIVAATMKFRSRAWRLVLATCGAFWFFDRWLGKRLYTGPPWNYSRSMLLSYLQPKHWPQDFSVVGFLWIPVWMGRKHLSYEEFRFLSVATVLMLGMYWFAVPVESRVWSEWGTAFAIFAAVELERSYASKQNFGAVAR